VPRIEVLPPLGTEGEAPPMASLVDISGGNNSPIILDFYHLGLNTYKRVFRGETDQTIERPREDHVVVRQRAVARVGVTPNFAAVIIGGLYEQLLKEEHSTVAQQLDFELESIRKRVKAEAEGEGLCSRQTKPRDSGPLMSRPSSSVALTCVW
jgi:hypothetical protein